MFRIPYLIAFGCFVAASNSLMANDTDSEAVKISTAHLLPISSEVRQVLDSSCVMCHGAVIRGERIVRDDIDLSSEESILATLPSVNIMLEVIGEDDMPQSAKLPRKLRRDPVLSAELSELKQAYEENGHKAILMQWLEAAVAKSEK